MATRTNSTTEPVSEAVYNLLKEEEQVKAHQARVGRKRNEVQRIEYELQVKRAEMRRLEQALRDTKADVARLVDIEAKGQSQLAQYKRTWMQAEGERKLREAQALLDKRKYGVAKPSAHSSQSLSVKAQPSWPPAQKPIDTARKPLEPSRKAIEVFSKSAEVAGIPSETFQRGFTQEHASSATQPAISTAAPISAALMQVKSANETTSPTSLNLHIKDVKRDREEVFLTSPPTKRLKTEDNLATTPVPKYPFANQHAMASRWLAGGGHVNTET